MRPPLTPVHFFFANGEDYASRIIERHLATRLVLEYFDSVVTFSLASNEGRGTDLTMIKTGVEPGAYLAQYAGWLPSCWH